MTPAALFLVVASSLAWAGLDALRKRLVLQLEPALVLLLLTVGLGPLMAAWWGWGAGAAPFAVPASYWWPALGSIALNVAANLTLLHAMRVAPLSLCIPLLSLTPVFTTLLAVPLLGERPSAIQGLGIALVVAGAVVLHPGLALAIAKPRSGRFPGVGLMAATALLWSATTPLDKLAVARVGAPLHGLILNCGVALGVLLLLGRSLLRGGRTRTGPPDSSVRINGAESRVPPDRGESRAWTDRGGREAEPARPRFPWWFFAAALAANFLGMAWQLLALAQVPAGFMETVKRALGNISAVAVGGACFGERVESRTLLAVLIMAIGVAAILL